MRMTLKLLKIKYKKITNNKQYWFDAWCVRVIRISDMAIYIYIYISIRRPFVLEFVNKIYDKTTYWRTEDNSDGARNIQSEQKQMDRTT